MRVRGCFVACDKLEWLDGCDFCLLECLTCTGRASCTSCATSATSPLGRGGVRKTAQNPSVKLRLAS